MQHAFIQDVEAKSTKKFLCGGAWARHAMSKETVLVASCFHWYFLHHLLYMFELGAKRNGVVLRVEGRVVWIWGGRHICMPQYRSHPNPAVPWRNAATL